MSAITSCTPVQPYGAASFRRRSQHRSTAWAQSTAWKYRGRPYSLVASTLRDFYNPWAENNRSRPDRFLRILPHNHHMSHSDVASNNGRASSLCGWSRYDHSPSRHSCAYSVYRLQISRALAQLEYITGGESVSLTSWIRERCHLPSASGPVSCSIRTRPGKFTHTYPEQTSLERESIPVLIILHLLNWQTSFVGFLSAFW